MREREKRMVEVEGTQTRLRCTLQYSPPSFEGGETKLLVCTVGSLEVHETVAGVAAVVAGEESSWSR